MLSEVRYLYQQLIACNQQLFEALSETEVVQHHCFILPPTLAGRENQYSEIIPVEYSNDYIGKIKLLGAFSKYKPEPSHSYKVPFRLPGVLQYPTSSEGEIKALIDSVNSTKEQFKQLITQSKLSTAEKHDLIKQVAPGTITLLIYRKINYFSDVKTVGFTWSNKFSTQIINKLAFIDYLKGSAQNPPSGVTRNEWEPFVQKEINTINNVKGDSIKIKRPLAAAPMANISFYQSKTVLRHAHLPFVIFSDHSINVKPLKEYLSQNDGRQSLNHYLINRLYALE
jgi:DNA replication terminus site-binding protein